MDRGGARRLRCGSDELLILLLEMGVMDTGGASPKTALRQQLMQVCKCGDGCARGAKVHAGARSSIEHPGCHHDDGARGDLNVDDLARGSFLAVLTSQTTPVQRVPAIENFDFLHDMGRMAP